MSQPGVPRWSFEEDSHHEEENNAEIKIMIRFEIKSCNGINRIFLELTFTITLRVIRRLGEGREDPKRVRITKRKTMQKTPRRIVLKSNRSMDSNVFVLAICVIQIGVVNAWACVCMGMCVHVHVHVFVLHTFVSS